MAIDNAINNAIGNVMEQSNSSSPRVALVTGGAKRVGAQIARCLHARGVNIAIHYRGSASEAAVLAQEFNAQRANSAIALQADLLQIDALAPLASEVGAQWGRLDFLVNNASSFFATPVGAIKTSDWDDLIGSNLKAPLFLTQAAAPLLTQSQGAVVNIIDIHTERPLSTFVAYNAAKSGLAGLTRSLALDLAPAVRVNGVSPGAIMWPEGEAMYDAAERERITQQVPLKRIGSALDIARTVEFLLLDAPYITGQIIAVDGGRQLAL
jgi:pteridine reductase